MTPMISVIIPVYNVGAFLRPCLDSVAAQSYTNIEVLLVNDGSTDDSGAICDEYAARDPRFRVFHKENGGISSARNCGMDHMQGEYIAFVDSDDRLTPDYLEVLYNDIRTHQVKASFCDFAMVDESGVQLAASVPRFEADKRLSSLDEILPYTKAVSVVWGCLLPADLTLQYRFSSLRYGEDSYFMFDLLCNDFPIYLNTHIGYFYLQRTSSVTATNTVPEILKLRDHLLVHAHRYHNLPDVAPSIRSDFLQTYAHYIHTLAYTAAQAENKAHREACTPLLKEHLKKVLPLVKELPRKLQLSLRLYACAPAAYNAYARFHARKNNIQIKAR